MESILRLPGKLYDHIHYNYGTIGLIVGGLVCVMLLLSIFFWFDRRRA